MALQKASAGPGAAVGEHPTQSVDEVTHTVELGLAAAQGGDDQVVHEECSRTWQDETGYVSMLCLRILHSCLSSPYVIDLQSISRRRQVTVLSTP